MSIAINPDHEFRMSHSNMASETARIVSKAQYNEQIFISIPAPTSPLAPSSLRVKTVLIGLTSNNISYCAGGDFLHWWSTYPVPATAPAPYNDTDTYGIAVGWGYCTVTDSTIDSISPGRMLYGFLPVSSHSVDLELRQVPDVPTHYIETSPHRQKVMNLYHRYILQPDTFTLDLSDPTVTFTPTVKPVWGASYVLANYVFAQNRPPIHPLGVPASPWTEKEANLIDACIVCVAAGTKTSRGFLQQLTAIDADKTPKYTVVEVTASPTGCEAYLRHIPFTHSRISYTDIAPSAFPRHRKYVLLNFGGRDDALDRVRQAVTSVNPAAEIVVLAIGGEAKKVSSENMAARVAMLKKVNAIQMNASGIKDEVMRQEGEVKYFEGFDEAWKVLLEEVRKRGSGTALGVHVKVSHGDEGLEECWTRLCAGEVAGNEGLLVRLNE